MKEKDLKLWREKQFNCSKWRSQKEYPFYIYNLAPTNTRWDKARSTSHCENLVVLSTMGIFFLRVISPEGATKLKTELLSDKSASGSIRDVPQMSVSNFFKTWQLRKSDCFLNVLQLLVCLRYAAGALSELGLLSTITPSTHATSANFIL